MGAKAVQDAVVLLDGIDLLLTRQGIPVRGTFCGTPLPGVVGKETACHYERDINGTC